MGISLLQCALGFSVVRAVSSALRRGISSCGPSNCGTAQLEDRPLSASCVFLIGVVLHLWLTLICRVMLDSLIYSSLIPLLLATAGLRDLRSCLSRTVAKLGIDSLLWMTVVLFVGASVLDTSNGISTAWANAYGDFAWHLGMLTSFVFGGNLPPEYHIYPGQTLSYPFFVNLWSAVLWAPTSFAWRTLPVVFLLQWIVCWGIVGAVLRGRGLGMLPWLLLFGGGTLSYAINTVFTFGWFPSAPAGAHQLIEKGYPWVPFITTIWVPQRAAVFGIALISTIIAMVFRLERELSQPTIDRTMARDLVLLALLVGSSLLVHTHFLIIAAALLLPPLVVTLYRHPFWRSGEIEVREREFWERGAALALLGLASALFALPWLIDKASSMRMSVGWMAEEWGSVRMTLGMWRRNAPLLVLNLIALPLLPGVRARGALCLAAFVAANCVIVSVWDWDQIKFFIVIYLIALAYLLVYLDSLPRWRRCAVKSTLVVLLTFPAVVETARLFLRKDHFTIYNAREMSDAAMIRNVTPNRGIIAAKPDHNTLITLTGRRLYLGYDGTLGSHGIEFRERAEINRDLVRLRGCESEAKQRGQRPADCPKWLLWTWRERGYWGREAPGEGFEVELPGLLYRIIPLEPRTTSSQ